MTRAKTITKLPLDRWAEIIGVSPVHFSGAFAPDYWDYAHACNDAWAQYSWQRPETASREHLADLISTATTDVENLLGYPVSPTYIHGEIQPFSIGSRQRRYPPLIETRWNKLINFGQYKKTLIDSDVLGILDDFDMDGWDEIVTVIFSSAVDPKNLRFYTVGYSDDAYRLYPTSIAQNAGVTTAIFHSWDLIDPNQWEKTPAQFVVIDANDPTMYELHVAVYEYSIDPTLPQAELMWGKGDPYAAQHCVCGGVGCTACGVTTQPACVTITHAHNGFISVTPASYDVDSATYLQQNLTIHAVPTYVKLYYTAGEVDQKYRLGESLNPMQLYLEEAITWLSAARLRFPICNCSGIRASVDDLMVNLVEVNKQRQTYISIIAPDMLTNPLGTRYGEAKAYDRLMRTNSDYSFGGGVL